MVVELIAENGANPPVSTVGAEVGLSRLGEVGGAKRLVAGAKAESDELAEVVICRFLALGFTGGDMGVGEREGRRPILSVKSPLETALITSSICLATLSLITLTAAKQKSPSQQKCEIRLKFPCRDQVKIPIQKLG